MPDWKVQTSEWNVENTSQWKTEDTDKFFYEIEEKNMIENVKTFAAKLGKKLKLHGNGSFQIQQVIYGAKNWRRPSCTDADEDGHQFDRNRRLGHDGLFPNCRAPQRC